MIDKMALADLLIRVLMYVAAAGFVFGVIWLLAVFIVEWRLDEW